MTPEAQVERVGEDIWAARDFLEQARKLLADGQIDALHDEGRQILLHSSAIAACDAILAVKGLAVTGSEGGHLLRLSEAQKQLDGGHADLFERLDDARDRRIQASYRAASIGADGVDEAVQAVGELVALAEELIDPKLPGWETATG